ncbi:NADP-dependent oxidoreductase [Micromonospora fluostatini]|uniref:NADP-dependent oxidoreductase n=1 Tax=Micromonospora sp. JCM 30529 TaxID=3421643 RepID=UPI003D16525F
MRAMRIHEYGAASVIRADDVPRPVPGPGEVLIQVAATSFNPSDLGLRRGVLRSLFPLDLPYTLGAEVAGTVVAVGGAAPVTSGNGRQIAVGDRVVGRLDGGGAAAEYVTTPADALVAAPTGVPLAHAAAIPVAGVTAWQAVFEHAHIRAGQRVLVNGAGGGVGGFAVQLARHAGARVVATAAPRSAEVVRRLGAEQIVDYESTPLADALDEPVDALLNLVVVRAGEAAVLPSLVRPGGVLVSVTVPVRLPAGSPVTATHFVARNEPRHLADLVRLVDAGSVRVDVSATRPLADLAAVHRDAEAGRTRGKVVLVP